MRTLKIILVLLVTIPIFVGFYSCKEKKKTMSIGVIIPLTGDYAKIGIDIKKAIEIAEEDAVHQGLIKEGQIKVYFEDNKLDATNTIGAYNKLKSINNIQAVITVTSKCILALKPLANKDKVLLLNASAISTEIEDSDDYCFSLIPNAESESKYLSEYILKKKLIDNIAIIYRNDQSGQSFNNYFSKSYISNGGVIPFIEATPVNTSDFRTIITKLKSNKNLKGVFMATLGVETANFLKQCKELNFNLPVFSYETINQPNAIGIADNLINNIEFVSPKFNPNDSTFMQFKQSLKAKYNSDEINFYMISHYNAYMLISKLVSKGFTNSVEFQENTSKLGSFKFLGSEIRIDKMGVAFTDLEIYGFKQKQVINIEN